MKAVLLPRYGSPAVLELAEVEVPTPTGKQVLVQVHAASANPLDWHGVRGAPWIGRLMQGFSKPKNPKVGADVAGTVAAVGEGVTEFQPGQAVFGVCSGSFAEYALAGESKLAHKPQNVSFEAAAAAPVAAFTALQGLRDKGQVQAGQQVLINGAAGGVGTFAVQIAKHYGAEVTAVTSTRNLDLVRSIGADHVVDYTRQDFTRTPAKVDLIYDAVGNRSVFAYHRALKPAGKCVIAGFTSFPRLFGHFAGGKLLSRMGSRQVVFQGIAGTPKEDLLVIRAFLESGAIVPVIDRSYPLNEAAEALRYLEQGHARGKVIIKVV
jgi:NADPH:quinone reductase-like Zn-dependent oxidoreductase